MPALFPRLVRGVLVVLLGGVAMNRAMAQAASAPAAGTIVFRAAISHDEWPGWGFDPAPNAPKPPPEQFEIVTSDGKTPRTFSGRVTGLDAMDGVEVGLVSLVGIPWTHDDAYQWQKVAPDGTFSITDARYLDADKAIAVRGPHTAWTFLRFNFAGNHSARNIVLRAAPSKKVTITASGPDLQNLTNVWVDQFDAHSQVDDHGNWLNREWGGEFENPNGTSLDAVLPVGEVALFVHRGGWAGFYQVVDTRQGDHFHFVLMPAGALKLKALTSAGQPRDGVNVTWKNAAAPLSYWEVTTDANGEFTGRNLVPGTFQIEVKGFGTCRAEVAPGAETDVVVQNGKPPVISTSKLAGAP